MKTLTFQNKEEWLQARRGKITGSRLKDIIVKRGSGKKIGFYELIAERLGIPADDESAMDRGIRLEDEAIEKYAEETKQKVNTDLVIWTRDDDESIAISPDGYIETKGKVKKAVECKCLGSARHIEAYLTQSIPKEYEEQKLQYFIVNDDLEELDFVFYDPRLITINYFVINIKREDIEKEIENALNYQVETLREVNEIVNKLTF